MKKVFKITLYSVLGLVAVFGVLTWLEFRPMVKGALSAEKLDEGLYYIEYKGDDGFDALMAKGGGASANDLRDYIIHFLSKGHYKTNTETKKGVDVKVVIPESAR